MRKLSAHYLRYGIHYLIVATAASCRAMSKLLYLIERCLYIGEFLILIKCIFNIEVSNVHAIADSIVFHKNLRST